MRMVNVLEFVLHSASQLMIYASLLSAAGSGKRGPSPTERAGKRLGRRRGKGAHWVLIGVLLGCCRCVECVGVFDGEGGVSDGAPVALSNSA